MDEIIAKINEKFKKCWNNYNDGVVYYKEKMNYLSLKHASDTNENILNIFIIYEILVDDRLYRRVFYYVI